ncbi:MAG TPA: phosphoribosylglycinamide synthetase C domain-containing protein, partial [Candidatus Dormibacteraeota bacterium]
AAAGYPGKVRGGDVITGLDDLDPDALLFHAGTRRDPDGTVRTAGGRVLTVVARGDDLSAARGAAYANLARVGFDGMQHRSDIADPIETAIAAGARWVLR